jgi:hypothetical protein
MFRPLLKSFLATVAFSTCVLATPIAADGTWHQFLFGAATSPVFACGAMGCAATINPVADRTGEPPWTFSGPGVLTVLDLFNAGDRFEAFDNLVSVGVTSVVDNTGLVHCGNDIGCALGDARYSRLVVSLGAGAHSLTFNIIQNALGTSSGSAVFQVAAIPEPGTLILLGGAFLGFGLLRRRR